MKLVRSIVLTTVMSS